MRSGGFNMMNFLKVEGNVVSVDIKKILPSPFQTRTVFNQDDLIELSNSICENGLLQPITLRRKDKDFFELVAGERRLRACKMAGIKKISAIICDMDDLVSSVFGYIENSQRTDLNPFEQAKGIQKLIEIWEVTQEQAAKRLGITQPTLSNKLRLLNLTPQEQEICVQYNLTERHARAALSAMPKNRKSVLIRAGQRQMSVSNLEALIAQQNALEMPRRRKAYMIKDVRIFANSINKAINFMRNAGIDATSKRNDTQDYIEYVVRIPVAQAVVGHNNTPENIPVSLGC